MQSDDKPLPTFGSTSPVRLKLSPMTSTEGDVDDGFLEIFDQEVASVMLLYSSDWYLYLGNIEKLKLVRSS